MDISTGKLQQLVSVARTGSFSKAAIELNISQPALSRSIAALENRCGFQIFNRLGHGVQPTAAGAQVIEQAQSVLQTLRVFDSNLKLFGAGKAGQLLIGMSPLLASELLSRFALEFFSTDTQAQLRVMIRPGHALLDELRNDGIELFFFPEGHIEPSPEVDIEPVGTITPVYVVRRSHPLAQRRSIAPQELAAFPWGSAVDPPLIENLLGPARFVCDNYHILREVMLDSDLICICSSAFVARHLEEGTVREIRVEGLELPTTAIYTAKLRGRVSSPLALDAVAQMKAYLN